MLRYRCEGCNQVKEVPAQYRRAWPKDGKNWCGKTAQREFMNLLAPDAAARKAA